MISIILPVYNVETYIEKCIQSILNQTEQNWELLIVDDGSTDQTPNISRQYAAETDKISYIRQENKGLGPARNTGLQYAKGTWVTFIDSDDWVAPDFLEILKKAQHLADADVVVCQYVRTFKDREEIDSEDRSYMSPGVYRRGTAEFSDIFQLDFIACGKLFRKSLFDGITDVFPAIAYEDYASIPYFVAKASTVSVINDAVYVWRNRSGSLTNQAGRLPDRAKSLAVLAERFQEGGFFELMKDPLEKFFLKRIHVNERLCADGLTDYRRAFTGTQQKLFHDLFGKDFYAPKLYVYGSYFSYVVGNILKCGGTKEVSDDYYGFSSLIGLINGGASKWNTKPFDTKNNFRKKAVVNELDTRFLKRTRTEFDDKDFVILDFMEERYDLGVDPKGHYVTLSDAFFECKPQIEGGYTVINRFSKETEKIWKESCDCFIRWLTSMISPKQIVLFRAKLAVSYGNAGKEWDYEEKEQIYRINTYLDTCYDYFEEHCPGIIVIDGFEQKSWYFTQNNFRHGRYPWHLNWYAYKQIANMAIEKIYFG